MSYRWVEHTAEAALEITAPSETETFEEALTALRELLQGDALAPAQSAPATAHGACSPERGIVSRAVELAATDRAALLAAWLDELVYLAETEDLLPEGVQDPRLEHERLTATVRARADRPRRLVKGVTYNDLSYEQQGEGVHATVVFDV